MVIKYSCTKLLIIINKQLNPRLIYVLYNCKTNIMALLLVVWQFLLTISSVKQIFQHSNYDFFQVLRN